MVKMCEHVVLGVIVGHPASGPCPSREELERHAQWFLGAIEYRREHPKQPGEEGYELWRHYQGGDVHENRKV